MKPVFQTRFGLDKGNCFAACIASITGIPIEDIDKTDNPIMPEFGKILKKFGLMMIGTTIIEGAAPGPTEPIFCIASGLNVDKSCYHAAVAVMQWDGSRTHIDICHDPAGHTGLDVDDVETVYFIIPRGLPRSIKKKKRKAKARKES